MLAVEANVERGGLLFRMNKSLIYQIHIHDPNFFFLTTNPITIPKIKIFRSIRSVGGREFYHMTYIRAIKHIKMNREKEPCGSGPGYNFVRCLKNSIARTVGCRLEWDRVSSDETPLCEYFDQVKKHEILYQKLGNMEQKELVETTGCWSTSSRGCHMIMETPLALASYSPQQRLCFIKRF